MERTLPNDDPLAQAKVARIKDRRQRPTPGIDERRDRRLAALMPAAHRADADRPARPRRQARLTEPAAERGQKPDDGRLQ